MFNSDSQFENGEIGYFHHQSGYFNTKTLLFEPYDSIFNWFFGHHKVQFNNIKDFENSRTDKQ